METEYETMMEAQPKTTKWKIFALTLVALIVVQALAFFALYSNAQFRYNKLESEYEEYMASYEKLRTSVNVHPMHHTEDEKMLVTPDDETVKKVVHQVTGGWSNPSSWDEFWSDVKAMYEWVESNIEYRSDPYFPVLPENPSLPTAMSEDLWQFPNDTLRIKSGDCEDMAILLLSMIRCYVRGEYDAYCIVVTQHVAVMLPVEEHEICILDPATHYTTNTGWPAHKLTSEDARTEIYKWLDYLNIANVKVEWLFSDSAWMSFSGTEDFLDWIYG